MLLADPQSRERPRAGAAGRDAVAAWWERRRGTVAQIVVGLAIAAFGFSWGPATLAGVLAIGWGLGLVVWSLVRAAPLPGLGRVDLGLWSSLLWLGLVVAAAVCAGLLPLAESRVPARALEEPILGAPDLWSSHPFGTDRQGLDLLGGVVYGARVSLLVGFGATTLGMLVGGALGMMAGFFRGPLDATLGRLNDALLAFPPLVLLLALASVMEANVKNTILALGVLAVPTFYRLARANTISVAEREFVLASEAIGARRFRTLRREILPGVVLGLLSYAFIMVAVLIVAEASLSYLGLGIQRPDPTWGNLISAGQSDFDSHPYLVLQPGLVLFLTVLALNRVGDRARRRLDPRSEKL